MTKRYSGTIGVKRGHRELELDDRTLELQLIRTQFLERNELFKRHREELQEYKRKGHKDYDQKLEAFCREWSVNEDGLSFGKDVLPDPIIQSSEDGFGRVILRIDLRYPRSMVKKQVRMEVDRWYDIYEKDLLYHILPELNSLPGNIPSDLQDYYRYLKLWDLKEEEGMSWSQIEKKLDISRDTARNWYNTACKFIKQGIPNLPPFPQE